MADDSGSNTGIKLSAMRSPKGLAVNIWLINHYAIPPNRAGGSRHYCLAKYLIRRGHEVTVIASSFDHTSRRDPLLNKEETGRLENFGGVPFLMLRSMPYGGQVRRMGNMVDFAQRLAYGRDVKRLGKPDIVVGSSLTLFAALAGLQLARRHNVPFILEIRDIWPATLVDFGMSPWHPAILMFGQIERYLYRSADAIVTLLPGAMDHMRSRGAGDKRIEYIPNGVDFSGIPAAAPASESRTFRLTFAGSFVQGNGLPTLLDAAELLQHRGRNDIQIRMIGGGGEKLAMMESAQQRGLRNTVFQDPVPKSEIWRALSESDALVALLQDIPLYRFGMSLNKLFDYMAAARPIIFSGRSCNDPVAESGGGLSVAPENEVAIADAVEKLADMSPAQRWAMGLRARRYAEEHHNFERLAEKLERVATDLVGTATRRASSAG